jgi:SAM-dependent methyltransferase
MTKAEPTWPAFLRELDARETMWNAMGVQYPREDAVPFMPYPIAQFVTLLTEAMMAFSRPRQFALDSSPGAIRFLDVGCGPGTKCRLAAAMFGLEVRGIDIVPRFIGEAQAHGVNAVVADAFDFLAADPEPGTYSGSVDLYDIVLVNRPSHLQDELESLVMKAMGAGSVLIAVNWKHDPAKDQGWHMHYQEYPAEPVCGVWIKP